VGVCCHRSILTNGVDWMTAGSSQFARLQRILFPFPIHYSKSHILYGLARKNFRKNFFASLTKNLE
jgi:hypothetical protein